MEDIESGSTNGSSSMIDKWANSLQTKLDDIPHYICSQAHPGRITRIPDNLREVDPKAYEPHFLSIGPYHHGKASVQHMDKRKHHVLKCVLASRPDLTLKNYVYEMKNIEQFARSFYSDVAMESKDFVQMLLLDSMYIVTAFCGMPQNQTKTGTSKGVDNEKTDQRTDTVTDDIEGWEDTKNMKMLVGDGELNIDITDLNKMPRWFWILFEHDIFLLENQLPFFVLQKMYSLTYGGPETQLLSIMKHKVGITVSDYSKLDLMVMSPTEEVYHLLHLCHLFFRPTLQPEPVACELPGPGQMFRLGSATQLYEAGVRFEARSDYQHSLLDITLGSSGNLVMPFLTVDDNTVSLLRNLISLDQMKYPNLGLHVSAYAVLLLHLVTIPADVELLRRKGIIQHHLASDKAMVYLVNRLSVGLSFDYTEDNYTLKPVFHELKRYTERRVPRWRAWLKHKYFNNPWTAIPLMVASLYLFFSILQTFYTVYSFYHTFSGGHL